METSSQQIPPAKGGDRTAADGLDRSEKSRRKSSPKNGAVQGPPPANYAEKVEISLRILLEAGVHFGHQTSRWNPQMAPYIYTTRNGIHIINLPKTIQCWQTTRKAIVDIVSSGGTVLFVGTKKQAHEAIVEEAKRCNSFYVSRRWLGGMLTNFQTIRRSIDRMKKLEETLQVEEELVAGGQSPKFTKKERLMISRELEKLEYSLGGIRDMTSLPGLLFVIDIRREEIAVKEARRLDVPVAALVDTNCDPTSVSYPIPSNDDGTRAIRLFSRAIADAILEGREIHQQQQRERGSAPRGAHAAPAPAAPSESKAAEPNGEAPPSSDASSAGNE